MSKLLSLQPYGLNGLSDRFFDLGLDEQSVCMGVWLPARLPCNLGIPFLDVLVEVRQEMET